jgi:hypothetical protein
MSWIKHMDFRSKVLTLGSILGALIILLFLGSFFSAQGRSAREASMPVVAGLDPDKAQKLDVTVKGITLELLKDDAGWSLLSGTEHIPASQDKVNAFMDSVRDLKRAAVVSTNPDTFPTFALDESAAGRIRMVNTAGAPLADLYIGKAAPGSGQYVRLAEGREVVQTDVQLSLSTELRDWVDLKLFPAISGNARITAVEIKNMGFFPDLGTSGDKTKPQQDTTPYSYKLGLVESDKTANWTLEGRTNLVLSESRVQSLINNFIDFSAEDLVPDNQEAAERLQHPAAVVTLTTEDGLRYSLIIGSGPPNKDFRYYVKSSEKKYTYMASEWVIMQIIKKPEELVDKETQAK